MTFQQLESVFQLFLTKHWSMKGKRITNAGMAVNKRDYVTKEELDNSVPLNSFVGTETDFKALALANPGTMYIFDDTDVSLIYVAFYYDGSYYRLQGMDF